MSEFGEKYGPWAVVAGASVGIGAEFCRQIAAEGINVVLVSRSVDNSTSLAAELNADHGVRTRIAAVDLAAPGAEEELFAATMGLDVGLFVYNAGADSLNTYFLDVPAEEWHGMLRRNCTVPLLASHHYGAAMVGAQARRHPARHLGRGVGRRRSPHHLRRHQGVRPRVRRGALGGAATRRRRRALARRRCHRHARVARQPREVRCHRRGPRRWPSSPTPPTSRAKG